MHFLIMNSILLNIVRYCYCYQDFEDYLNDYKVINEPLYDVLPPLNLSWFERPITSKSSDRVDGEKIYKEIKRARIQAFSKEKISKNLIDLEGAVPLPKPKKQNKKKKVKSLIFTKKVNSKKFKWSDIEELNDKVHRANRSPLEFDVTVKESPTKDVEIHVQLGKLLSSEMTVIN